MTSPSVSGHGGVQRSAASEAAQTLPAPPPPSESCQQRSRRYRSVFTKTLPGININANQITHTRVCFPLRQLRASVDQRVHYAVVPHHVRHLPAGAHRAEDLGLGFLRGFRGSVPGRPRHLGETGRVSGARNKAFNHVGEFYKQF